MSEFQEITHVGAGWRPLLSELDDMLKYLSPEYSVLQVKQKFGTLRLYAEYVPKPDETNRETAQKMFYSLIHHYESRTTRMCEVCGEFGTLYNNRGSLRTRCVTHGDVMPSEVGEA